MSDPRPAIPNVNWADHPGVWVDYLRDDRAWLIRENQQLRGNLSLAEEGLANYQQELTDLRQAYEYHKGNAERLRVLMTRAVDTMAALHRAIEPMHDDPELAGRVPPAAMRAFVDALASIDRERSAQPQSGDAAPR